MMKAGELDLRVTLRRATVETNDFGEDVETWSDLATVWASRKEVSNRERFAAQQVGFELVARFRIRYSTRVGDLSPQDRMLIDGQEYNITGVAMIGRREGFEITASYRESQVVEPTSVTPPHAVSTQSGNLVQTTTPQIVTEGAA